MTITEYELQSVSTTTNGRWNSRGAYTSNSVLTNANLFRDLCMSWAVKSSDFLLSSRFKQISRIPCTCKILQCSDYLVIQVWQIPHDITNRCRRMFVCDVTWNGGHDVLLPSTKCLGFAFEVVTTCSKPRLSSTSFRTTAMVQSL